MTALIVVAASSRGGRRIREVAVAATFGITQVFASRYVGNVSGFGAIYIIRRERARAPRMGDHARDHRGRADGHRAPHARAAQAVAAAGLQDRAVVQAVSDIAAATGVQVVAEGVETEAQREILLSINPDFLAQGWLFAKALPVEDFEAWVLEQQRLAVA